jgi:tetratricopeptide (TPR) repeat protein
MKSPSNAVDMAFALLREGRAVDAHELMVREVRTVEERHGRGSVEWASARCDLGNILLNSDLLDQAVECYRDACSGPVPAAPDAHKDHLTYRLNLGTALQLAGRLDEAEAELRRNLEERMAFYGREHAGYGFGLEALADVLLRQGNTQGAWEVIEETLENFRRNHHERAADALAARAEIMKVAGMDGPSFPRLDELPDFMVDRLASAARGRVGEADPEVAMAFLRDLVLGLETRLGPDHKATLDTLAVLANTGRDSGDQAGRVEAIGKVLAAYDRKGWSVDGVNAALGLALAMFDAGDQDGGLRAYEDARERADRVGHPETTSQVLRNWGLALAEADRFAEAEERMREAVAYAERGADHEVLGRAHIALGLFLQHRERLDEARQVVEAGLAVMDAAHPDAIVGRGHLGAIHQGRSCGCGMIGDSLGAAFREFVLARLPADLLSGLDVKVEDGEFKVSVELSREPVAEEIDRLNRVINSATAEFRRRVLAP